MIVEASSKVRNNDVRCLFGWLDLFLIAWLYKLHIIGYWGIKVHMTLLCVLVDPSRKSYVRIRVNKHFQID